MSDSISIFVSHVSEDETIALSLKDYLEGIFLNASVFVSGRDLVGGQVWIEELRRQLDGATAILAVVSPRSVSSRWVYFEAGAGLCHRRTIPLLVPGMNVEDVGPPFSLLQLRRIDRPGLETMVRDIAGLGNMRSPSRFPGLEKSLEDILAFLALRKEEEPVEEEAEDDFGLDSILDEEKKEEVDPDLQRLLEDVENRGRQVMIRAIKLCEAPFDIPSDSELQRMRLSELFQLAGALGLSPPLGLLTMGDIPEASAPAWKKANERNRLNDLKTRLGQFEASAVCRSTSR
jgi:hypothetical protein